MKLSSFQLVSPGSVMGKVGMQKNASSNTISGRVLVAASEGPSPNGEGTL